MNFDIEDEEEKEEIDKRSQYEDKQKIHLILIFFFAIGTLIVIITLLVLRGGKSSSNQQQPTAPKQINNQEIKSMEKQRLTVFNEESNERPIAVMIDNAIGEAKHAGLQESYLNYEILVEGGLTRIMSIYKDKDVPLIGPIRSSRHYFIDYVLENDAIYVHYGWSPYAQKDEEALNINNVNGLVNPDPFRRDSKAIAPHNVFTKLPYIKSFLDRTSYNQTSENWQLLKYSATSIDLDNDTDYQAKQANSIHIPYSPSEYRTYNYDANSQYYLRSTNGKPHMDRKSEKQLHYKNIIIQRTDYEVIDQEGRIDVKTIGSGNGYLITNGKFLPIKWAKSSRSSKTIYSYENGQEITLNDGNTFIQIVPTNTNITIE